MKPSVSSIQWDNRSLWRLTWPLAVELLLAVFIGMADTIMVTTVGESAVSGISLVDSINMLLVTLFSALATGGAVVISQYLGRRDAANASEAAKQLLYSITAVSLLLAVAAFFLRRLILQGVYSRIDEDVMGHAQTYFWLSALSYPFLGLYNAGAAIFRSMGNSRVSMFVSVAMNVINVSGNAILIFGAGWGVAGAGTASLLSRIVAAAVVVWLLRRARSGPVQIQNLTRYRPDWPLIRSILKVGVPNGLENSMFNIGKLMVARVITVFGTAAIAANAIAGNILNFGNVPGQAIGLALLTVIGQCAGARDAKAARRYTRKLMVLCHISMGATALILFAVLNPLLGLFNLSEEAIAIARQCCLVYCIFVTPFWPASFALPNALRAAGDARFTMVVSIVSMWACRICLSFIFAYDWGLGLGVMGVWLAMVVDWVVRTVLFTLRWHGKKWESKRLLE